MSCRCNSFHRDVGHYLSFLTTPGPHPCINGWRDVISVVSGGSSIVIWALILSPRMYYSWSYGEMFLNPVLAVGDITNLAGTYLTGQLPTQIYLAILFVAADLFIVLTVCYAKRKYADDELSVVRGDTTTTNIGAVGEDSFTSNWIRRQRGIDRYPINSKWGGHFDSYGCEPLAASTAPSSNYTNEQGSAFGSPIIRRRNVAPVGSWTPGRSCLICIIAMSLTRDVSAVSDFFTSDCPKYVDPHTMSYTIGCVVAWISALMYAYSRTGIIYQNYVVKSVYPPNAWLFFLTFLGYATYSVSVVFRVKNETWFDPLFYQARFPYIVGSLSPMLADMIILIQSLYYGSSEFPEAVRGGYAGSVASSQAWSPRSGLRGVGYTSPRNVESPRSDVDKPISSGLIARSLPTDDEKEKFIEERLRQTPVRSQAVEIYHTPPQSNSILLQSGTDDRRQPYGVRANSLSRNSSNMDFSIDRLVINSEQT